MNATSLGLARRVLAEPLVRFAIAGLVLFALAGLSSEERTPPNRDGAIVLDEAGARRLASQFQAVWRREPTRDELDALMRRWVEEEAMVREARALGLDDGDAVVRQRLHQKMVFFAESRAASLEPSDEDLRAHMAQSADRYALPAVVSFQQIYLGESPPEDEVAKTLDALAGGAEPDALGTATLLPSSMAEAARGAVDGTFGVGVFDRLAETEGAGWMGPFATAFGVHVVRVTEHEAAKTPPLQVVRERVLEDWRASQADAARNAFIEALVSERRIQLPVAAEVLGR